MCACVIMALIEPWTQWLEIHSATHNLVLCCSSLILLPHSIIMEVYFVPKLKQHIDTIMEILSERLQLCC